ncbi:MAG TPA: P-type conjugative transfer ATPase TrbB, partial [Thermoanaerobaculia bacterium]|nr:P-type conjugative transfer ATPase TrbB [Thermoanaerobaculia bacterium]
MRPAAEQDEERARHFRESLARTVGPAVMGALAEPDVNEIYANPDGRLYFDTRSAGRVAAGAELEPKQVQKFLNLVASAIPTVINALRPQLQAELPAAGFLGSRLQGFVWPLSAGPSFNLRKPPAVIYSLESYVAAGAMTAA